MYKRFVNPKAKNNNEVVIVLCLGFKVSKVKVVSTGKVYWVRYDNLQNLTNSELLDMPKYHRG